MHFGMLLLLGFVAGATITFGLPAARLRSFSPVLRSSLSMVATGILVFLLVEILGDAGSSTVEVLDSPGRAAQGIALVLLLAAGLAVGFVGLVWFEQRVIRGRQAGGGRRLSFMIAAGIGLHNLSEGLAIGQTYAQGAAGLTVVLIVGFALHNTTEGFGIVGPAMQTGDRLPWRTLGVLGLIGGGPTFVGTLLGSLWTSPYLSVAVLAMAGGALLYVVKTLFTAVSREARQLLVMAAVVLGFMIGWVTAFAADRGVQHDAVLASRGQANAIVYALRGPTRSSPGPTAPSSAGPSPSPHGTDNSDSQGFLGCKKTRGELHGFFISSPADPDSFVRFYRLKRVTSARRPAPSRSCRS